MITTWQRHNGRACYCFLITAFVPYFVWQYCLAVSISLYNLRSSCKHIPRRFFGTSFSSCKPGIWRPCCASCPPSKSGWPVGRTCSWSGWLPARTRTCWQSSGRFPGPRCTRWRGWPWSPGGKSQAKKATGHRPLLQLLCAGKKEDFSDYFQIGYCVLFYHGKTVAKPQWLPILWTVGNVHILAVNCDHIGLHLAHHTPEHIDCCISALYSDSKHKPRYKLWNGVFGNRHHRNRFVGRQPVGFVVSARVVAHIVEIAEKERHRVELSHTRPSASCIF